MGIHDGHRDRIFESFFEVGLKGKTEHQALEILLTFLDPRKDVNPLAHELINTFGSLANVMDADVEDLVKFKGITNRGAALIKLIPELAVKYHESKFKAKPKLNTYSAMRDYMIPKLSRETNEVFYVMCFDAQLNLLRAALISEGSPEKATIDIRTLIDEVLKSNACQVVLVHNHLSGSVLPSAADIITTKKITEALETLGVKVLDHLIISGDKCFNISELTKIKKEFE